MSAQPRMSGQTACARALMLVLLLRWELTIEPLTLRPILFEIAAHFVVGGAWGLILSHTLRALLCSGPCYPTERDMRFEGWWVLLAMLAMVATLLAPATAEARNAAILALTLMAGMAIANAIEGGSQTGRQAGRH